MSEDLGAAETGGGGAGAASLAIQVESVPWYHSIELPGGIVTPGEYDLRATVARLPLPASLAGRRCLDVGTHDGFWAFEMERRGGAEVVAIDLDDPSRLDWPGRRGAIDAADLEGLQSRRRAFDIARAALGSGVQRRDLSVYDLSPEDVGTFDFAFMGTLLHHLRDPVGALMAVRRVVSGTLLLTAAFSISKTVMHPGAPVVEMVASRLPFWGVPNLAGLRRQVEAAGWDIAGMGRPFLERYGPGRAPPALLPSPRAWAQVPRRLVLRFGAPHVWLLAESSGEAAGRRG